MTGEYYTVSVIVSGALASDSDVSPDDLKAYIDALAANVGEELTEIYVLHHPHGQGVEECDCIQYASDHRPLITINSRASKAIDKESPKS